MTHEGTWLSITAGVGSERVDYIFSDRPWLQPLDAPGTMLRWKHILKDPTPLPQVLWVHEALNMVFIASEDSLVDVMKVMQHVHRSVQVNAMHLIVLGHIDTPLYDGAVHLREKVPWAWIEISKFQRPLSRTGSVHLHA